VGLRFVHYKRVPSPDPAFPGAPTSPRPTYLSRRWGDTALPPRIKTSWNQLVPPVKLVHWDGEPISQEIIPPYPRLPHQYSEALKTWVHVDPSELPAEPLPRGAVIKVVSWNLAGRLEAGIKPRVNAAVDHLIHVFGQTPGHLVIMLQEVTINVFDILMQHPWVRENFQLSEAKPPTTLVENLQVNPATNLPVTKWQAAHYFTLMLVSKTLFIQNCFRVPFTTQMGRDALVVDILCEPKPATELGQPARDLIRLCTTHLESGKDPKGYRHGQLVRIAGILNGTAVSGTDEGRIVGGMVGGSMNSHQPGDHKLAARPEIQLLDVINDSPRIPTPSEQNMLVAEMRKLEADAKKELAYTWGYQSIGRRSAVNRRLDKFLCTIREDTIETVPIKSAQKVVGTIGQLGVGLKVKADVAVWDRPPMRAENSKGEGVLEPTRRVPISDRLLHAFRHSRDSRLAKVQKKQIDMWVSDHVAVVVGIRLNDSGPRRPRAEPAKESEPAKQSEPTLDSKREWETKPARESEPAKESEPALDSKREWWERIPGVNSEPVWIIKSKRGKTLESKQKRKRMNQRGKVKNSNMYK